MKIKPDRCPKCGESARCVVMMVECRVPFTRARQLDFSELKRTHKPIVPPAEYAAVSCGGRHMWTAEIIDDG